MNFKCVISVFSDFLTPLIAIITIYIAWQQYKINKHCLRDQLYERRLKVYKATMLFLSEIVKQGTVSSQRAAQFYAETSEASFIFSESIASHLVELYEKGIDLDKLYEQSEKAKEKGELLKWFIHQIKETKESFKQEMKIG